MFSTEFFSEFFDWLISSFVGIEFIGASLVIS